MTRRLTTTVVMCCLLQIVLWATAMMYLQDPRTFVQQHGQDELRAHPAILVATSKSKPPAPVHEHQQQLVPLAHNSHAAPRGKKHKLVADRPAKPHAHAHGSPKPKPSRKPPTVDGLGRPAAPTTPLLAEPVFELFEGATIRQLAAMDTPEFMRRAFRKLTHTPLASQRPRHLGAASSGSSSAAHGDSMAVARHDDDGGSIKHKDTTGRNNAKFAPLAYALLISNEEFVDGAMVLGASLLNNSPLLRSGAAELVLIVTEQRIGDDSKRRLKEVGFTVIAEVPSMAKYVPGAALKDTFDKIFMFALVMFERVVFMDADMLNVKSADELFEQFIGPDVDYYVAAIGFRKSSAVDDEDYFQTGMMVFKPSTQTFARVLDRFVRNIPPRGRLYNVGMNGRDGVLIRDVFRSNFTEVSNKHSRNMNPRLHVPDEVVSLHFRGRHKMWFDRRWANADPYNGKKEFGFNYVAWWAMYEKLHRNSDDYRVAATSEKGASGGARYTLDALGQPYGGQNAGPGVGATTHAWMMRHTSREYVQLIHEVEDARNCLALPGMSLVKGKLGQSCDAVCASASAAGGSAAGAPLKCVPRALNFTQLNNCSVLQSLFGCEECEMGVYWRPHPGREFPGLDVRKKKGNAVGKCIFNYRHDERCFPTCDAYNETTSRLCPCAPPESVGAEPVSTTC